jgi:hypothetical protein
VRRSLGKSIGKILHGPLELLEAVVGVFNLKEPTLKKLLKQRNSYGICSRAFV